LCVAWLEGFADEDEVVDEDTTVAGVRVLVGVVVVGVVKVVGEVDVNCVVVRGVTVVAVVVGTTERVVSVGAEMSVVAVAVPKVSEPEGTAVEPGLVAPLQRFRKNASAAWRSAVEHVVERH